MPNYYRNLYNLNNVKAMSKRYGFNIVAISLRHYLPVLSLRYRHDIVEISPRYHLQYRSDIAEIVRFIQIFAQCRRDVESVIEYRDNIVATSRLYKYHHIAGISRGYREGIVGVSRGNIAGISRRGSCKEVVRKLQGSGV